MDDADMKVLLRGMDYAREIAATEPVAQYFKGEAFPGPEVTSEADLRAHVRLAAKTVYHPVGSCKMGTDAMSVVDPQLRLHGLEGLRVADASIMPRIVGGNTNAPSIMIGERAADLIRAK
jgi:choline dehydrogenase-like flavoprotein